MKVFVETLGQDLHYSLRILARKPGFMAMAVLTLALGIGANTAIFSVINAVLLRPLPIGQPERVVQIWDRFPQGWGAGVGVEDIPVSYPNFRDYSQQNQVFERMAAFRPDSMHSVDAVGATQIRVLCVSPDFFPLFDVQPRLGRSFRSVEYESRDRPVVVLTHPYWQQHFGGDPDVLGQTLKLNSWWGGETGWQTLSFTIVGILPAGLDFPPLMRMGKFWTMAPEVLVPLSFGWSWEDNNRGMYALQVLGRLKPGVAIEQAQANMDAIASEIAEAHPETSHGYRVEVTPLRQVLSNAYGQTFLLLLGAAGAVLLIACVNVASLLLARAVVRDREFAVRAALGAGRLRLLRQLLTESTLLSVLGGGAGLLLASGGTRFLVAALPGRIPRLDEVGLDVQVLGFTLLVSLVTATLFGMIPAWRASRLDVQESLKERARGSAGGRNRLLQLFVVTEVALALVLLIGAGLMMNSFLRLVSADPGFNIEKVLTMRVSLLPPRLSKYQTHSEVGAFYQGILERIGSLPGVLSVAGTEGLPLDQREYIWEITIPGRDLHATEEKLTVDQRYISANYFRTMGIPVLRGRSISAEEEQSDSPRIAVINQTMARRYWPNQDPLGKGFYWGLQDLESGEWDPRYPPNWYSTVVGVVGDVKAAGLHKQPQPQAYIPFVQIRRNAMTLVVRTTLDPLSTMDAVRAEIRAVDKNEPQISNISTLEQYFSRSVAQPRFYMLLMGMFATLAVVLALVGLYSVMSYSVSQRTPEMGIRIAMGAQRSDILRLVVGQGMLLTLIGVAFGLAGAWAVTRFFQGLLFGVSPTDPLTFAGIATLLTAVSLLACYLPARRATKVDPMVALRFE